MSPEKEDDWTDYSVRQGIKLAVAQKCMACTHVSETLKGQNIIQPSSSGNLASFECLKINFDLDCESG